MPLLVLALATRLVSASVLRLVGDVGDVVDGDVVVVDGVRL